MPSPSSDTASWSDVLGEGRLPRFALICLGVWLNAADSLVTSTIMPSVGRSLGGYPYFGWATAGYLLGSVLAGASSGILALRFGLRSAKAAAAILYATGCVLSAVAPEIFTFLAGRVLQGIGGGWVVGLCSTAVGLLFANRLLPRAYSAVNSVWGIAVPVGPLLGGLLVDAGSDRRHPDEALTPGLAILGMTKATVTRDGKTTVRHRWRVSPRIASRITM
jgi:MFS family permease